MSDLSGLNLNADKTELITNSHALAQYSLTYNQNTFLLAPCKDIKLNGIYVSYDSDVVRVKNFEKIYLSVEKQLKMWSSRNLSLLGKIQIFKTFGLSQILFASSTIMFTKHEDKQLTNLIYKFIWTRNMDGNKAPDRIKRSILNQNIKSLGFGMIDFKEVITSIRVKNVLRLLNNPDQPLNNIISSNINSSIIKIKCLNSIRPTIDAAIDKIREMWSQAIKNHISNGSTTQNMINVVLNEYVGNLTYPRFNNKRLVLAHKHDRLLEIRNISESPPIIKKLDKSIQILLKLSPVKLDNYSPPLLDNKFSIIPIKDKLKDTKGVSSRQIRHGFKLTLTIPPKMIEAPDPDLIINLGFMISKLTNVRNKTIILRAIHGDIYCGTRLKKFGMTETDLCPRCNIPETISHQLTDCLYVRKIWDILTKITGIKINSLSQALGHDPMHDKITLTIHAEIIRQLMSIERPTLEPIKLVRSTVKRLAIVERGITKFQINKMLDELSKFTC